VNTMATRRRDIARCAGPGRQSALIRFEAGLRRLHAAEAQELRADVGDERIRDQVRDDRSSTKRHAAL
jgi:hypothetical protein